jgi:flavodoxin I
MRFTIIYASATGHTEDIAERLNILLPGSDLKNLDEIDFTKEIEEAEALICCTPTWNTASDIKRSGTTWDDHIDNIPHLSLKDKPIAIVGLGDSAAFSKYFCDAMEELYKSFESAGGRMIGHASVEGYTFDNSKSVIGEMFCGLPIDEHNESEKTDDRLQAWSRIIIEEARSK